MKQSNTAHIFMKNIYQTQTLNDAYSQQRIPLIVAKWIEITVHSIPDKNGNPTSPYPDNLRLVLNVGDIIEFWHKNWNYFWMINWTAITVNWKRALWLWDNELKEINILKLSKKYDTGLMVQEYLSSAQWKNEVNMQNIREKQRNNQIEFLNYHLEEFKKIEPNNLESILDWINSFQDILNNLQDRKIKDKIYDEFLKKGFKSNINTNNEFNSNNKEKFALYIVWQFLEWLKTSTMNITFFIKKYIIEWKSIFWSQAQLDIQNIEALRKNL
ncbi:MAG: hypothetical protein ACD_49C00009G0009 [uncultured bacterium (gcode 4)]|uniref:Uncharacterized protein n=1 Tax=uncultured bacterium (gcode 4) TaxID=1234023 RepID=K2BX61_9BACT|nr:MAG: hypothetical protein ACD_49C00009G0009 [uncultured bacterium (gcode 4)]